MIELFQRSILIWQEQTGRGAVSFGDTPDACSIFQTIGRENARTIEERAAVRQFILVWNITPITTDVARKELDRALKVSLERFECSGCCYNFAEGEKDPCYLPLHFLQSHCIRGLPIAWPHDLHQRDVVGFAVWHQLQEIFVI